MLTCPLCNAFKDPNTGNCLVCGKDYHVLDIPTDDNNKYLAADFLIPFKNGYITFQAAPKMEVIPKSISFDEPQVFRYEEAQLNFTFIPQGEEGVLFSCFVKEKI